MADCLYQCLKEAKLEKYFRNFVNGGLQHCESLLQLSMQEYPRYGVVLMEDRLRLFKLIQIVKSVQADGMVCKHGISQHGKHFETRNSAAFGVPNRNIGPGDNILRPVPLQVQQVQTTQSNIGAPQRAGRKSGTQVIYKGSGDSPVFNCRKTLKFSDSDMETDSDDSVSVQLWDTQNNDRRIQKQLHAESNNNKAALVNGHIEKNLNEQNGDEHCHNIQEFNKVQKKGKANNIEGSESVFLKACDSNTKVTNGNHRDHSNQKEDKEEMLKPRTDSQLHSLHHSNSLKTPDEAVGGKLGAGSSINKENIAVHSSTNTSVPLVAPPSSVSIASSSVSNTKPAPQAFFISTSPAQNNIGVQCQDRQKSEQGQTVSTSSASSQSSQQQRGSTSGSTIASSSVFNSQNSHSEQSQNHMMEQGVIYKPMSSVEQRHIVQSQPKPFQFKNFHPPSVITGGQHSYFPSVNPGSSVPSSSAQKSSTHVEKVYHNCGYSYGVPSNAVSGIPSEKKQSGALKPGEEKIRVCIRKRPLLEREVKRNEVDIVKPQGSSSVIVEEAKMTVNLSKYLQQHMFKFDEVFGESCDNQGVYNHTVKPLIQFVFNRGSATCFAFGQTGSGKSYTLLGSKGVPGLYQLAATDIFSYIDTLKSSPSNASHMHLWASYYEIYCSHLFDLLNKRKRLHVRENSRHKVCIVGLMETEVHSVKGLVEVVQYGNASRSTGVSGNNSQSSRSHAVLQLEVRDAKDCKVGRLSFIDLAGSERATDMTDSSDKQTRIEGAEINQSLLALKECIRSLDQDSGHTPYRQSKLTHILRDSFIGNSHTVMIANVSPCMSSCVHTLNTLKYADRVKELKKDQDWKLNNVMRSKNKPATPQSKQGQWNKTPSSGKGSETNAIQRSGSMNRHLATSSSGKILRQQSAAEVAFVKQMEKKDHTPDKEPPAGLFLGNGMQFASTPKSKCSPSEGDNMGSPFDVSKILREESDTPIRGHKLNRHTKDHQKSSSDPVGPTKLDFDNMTEDFEMLGGLPSNGKSADLNKKIQHNQVPENVVNINEHKGEASSAHNKIFIGADKVNELIRIQKERLSVGNEDIVEGSCRSRSRVKPDRGTDRSPQNKSRSKSSGRVLESKRPHEEVERRSKSIEKGLPMKNDRIGSPEGRHKTFKTDLKTPDTQAIDTQVKVSGPRMSDYPESRSRSKDRLSIGSYPIKSHEEIMAEHREVLDHLDSLLDRAKAAITVSPTSSPTIERKSELKKQFSTESTDSKSSETTRTGENKPLASILKKTPTSEGISSALFLSNSAGKEKVVAEFTEEDCVDTHSTRHSDPLARDRYFGGTLTQNNVPSSRSMETISQTVTQDEPHKPSSSMKGIYNMDSDVIVLDDSSEGKRMDSPCIRPASKQVFPISNIASEKHTFGPSHTESVESSRPDQFLQRSNSHGSDRESERSSSRNMSWHDILSQSQNEPKSKDSSYSEKSHKPSRTNSRDMSVELQEERRGITTKAMIKDIDTIVIETDVPATGVPETGRSTGDSGFSTGQSRDPDKFGHSNGSHRSTDNQSDTDTLDDVVSLSSAAVTSQESNKPGLNQGNHPVNKYSRGPSDMYGVVQGMTSHTKGEAAPHVTKSNIVPPLKLTFNEESEHELNGRSNNSARSLSDKKVYYDNCKMSLEDEYLAQGSRGTQSARNWTDKHKSSLHVHQDSAFTVLPENRDLETRKPIAKPQAFDLPTSVTVSSDPNSVPNKVKGSGILPKKVRDGGTEFSPIEAFPITPRKDHVITVPAVVSKPGSETSDTGIMIGPSHAHIPAVNSEVSSKQGHSASHNIVMSNRIQDNSGTHMIETTVVKNDVKVNRELFPSDIPLTKQWSERFSYDREPAKVNRELFPSDPPDVNWEPNLNSATKVKRQPPSSNVPSAKVSAEINSGVGSSDVVLTASTTADKNNDVKAVESVHSVTGVRLKESTTSDNHMGTEKPAKPLVVDNIKGLTTDNVSNKAAEPSSVPSHKQANSTSVQYSNDHTSAVTPQDLHYHYQQGVRAGKMQTIQNNGVLHQQKSSAAVNGTHRDMNMQGVQEAVKVTSQTGVDENGGRLLPAAVDTDITHRTGHSEVGEEKANSQKDGVHLPQSVRQPNVNKIHQAQEKLMMQHEEQLTKMTALCKQEMKLLMASRMTRKGFPEYVRALEEILSDKGRAILLLKSKIDEYVAMVNNE